MRTLGRKIIELDPPQGFAAETTGASIMFVTAFLFHAPISTTHVITSAIMGVGCDEAGERGALGRRQEHRPGLVHHDAGRGRWWPRCSFWLVDLVLR